MTASCDGRPGRWPPRPWPGEPAELWRTVPAAAHRPDARPAVERIVSMREAPTFDYPRARAIRGRIACAVLAGTPSASTLLLYGPTGNGRSMVASGTAGLIRKMAGGPRAVRTMHMPPAPTPQKFWIAARDASGPSAPSRAGGIALRQATIVEEYRTAALDGLRLLVVDGSDALLAVRPRTIRAVLDCVAHMSDAAGVAVLLVGSMHLAVLLRGDQDRTSIEYVELPAWRVNADWLRLLSDLEAALPLRLPSDLADRGMAMRLWALSGGRIGPLWEVLRTAAEAAISLKYESIDEELLDDLGLVVPEDFGEFRF